MIAKRFGFTRDFLKERNTGLYCRLKKIPCGFKDRARACLLMDFPGLTQSAGKQNSCYRRTHRFGAIIAVHLTILGTQNEQSQR